ncbi:MAG: hypothetical protein Q3X52_11370, partial [Alistipes sp.]|uniref:hypothetical protein n=1 Tax=Alistipes sp. TaxID=1872444 RepID=UPI00283F9E70
IKIIITSGFGDKTYSTAVLSQICLFCRWSSFAGRAAADRGTIVKFLRMNGPHGDIRYKFAARGAFSAECLPDSLFIFIFTQS